MNASLDRVTDYFKKLSELLKIEREEDRLSYLRVSGGATLSERRASGLLWYPISIRDSEMGRGDYLTVEVERVSNQDVPHQLRFGASVALFSQHDPGEKRLEGVVSYLNGNRLTINLRTEELPEWSGDGKLGVDLLFDDNSYEEMQNTLKLASRLLEKPGIGDLIQILTGERAPGFHSIPEPPASPASPESPAFPATPRFPLRPAIPVLNPSQQEAVTRILSARELAIVHGPPGTGKTTTLVQAIKALIRQDPRQILVVAPSNTAVDLLCEKCSEEGLNVLRVGNPARVSERLMSLTLDSRISEHAGTKEIKKWKKQANDFRNMAQKYKRSFGKAEREQRKALFDEARRIMKEVERTELYITEDLLTKAQVIAATLVGANHYTVRSLSFGTVVIDEAGQALEPACWIPILKAQKVVLAGDPNQLPPTVKSDEAARKGLGTSLLEKNVLLHPEAVVLLEEQYRMHEMIMGFSSRQFYGDRLKAHASVANRVLFPGDKPLIFVDTAGCGFDEKTEGTSTINPEEAAFLFRHLVQLVDQLGCHYSITEFPTIAVISPYQQQIQALKEQMHHSPSLAPYQDKISVNTIDSFQGQERDIVYISMTRSNTENKIGFLSDIRRMNVAMTRARKKLVVIGDSATLSRNAFYSGFIAYADEKGAYQSAWEFME
jgi:ATP-dependent RNA/DNA helicase IGHMBP2